jgi:glycosyltransferase 2 family protein
VPVGYMGNTVLPARGGEVLRILLMAERSDARRRTLLGSVLSERTLDAATLIVLLGVLTLAGVAGNPAGSGPAVGGVVALAVGGLALWGYLHLRRRGRFQRLADLARPVVGAARPLIGPPGLVLAAATLVTWMLEAVIFWLVGAALDLHITLFEGCLLLVLTAFFSLIPAAPGYVGTFDAAVVFGLKALGVTGGVAVSYALLVRFVLFVPITVVGLGLLVARYGGLRQLRRRDAPEEPATA